MNMQIRSIKMTKEEIEKRNEMFSNIGKYKNICPVCEEELNKSKIYRKTFTDVVTDHEFKVCVHKKCIDKVTHADVCECLSYDPEFSNISYIYQDIIIDEITDGLLSI